MHLSVRPLSNNNAVGAINNMSSAYKNIPNQPKSNTFYHNERNSAALL